MIRRACVVLVALAVCFVPAAWAEDGDEEENKLKHFVFRGYLSWLSISGEETIVGTPTPVAGTPNGICLLDEDCFSVGMGEGSGFQANFEFRATHLLGIEIGATTHDVNGELVATVATQSPLITPTDPATTCSDTVTLLNCDFYDIGASFNDEIASDMVYVGVNFHVWKKNSGLDVYVGPFFAEVTNDDATITTPEIREGNTIIVPSRNLLITYADDSAWGLNGGFDVGIGPHWFVGGSLRYVASEVSARLINVDDPAVNVPLDIKMNPFIFSVGGGIRF